MTYTQTESVGVLPTIYTQTFDSMRFASMAKSSFNRLYLVYAFPTIGKTHAITELRKLRVADRDPRDHKIVLVDTDDLVVHVRRMFGHSRDYAIARAILTYLDQHPDHYMVLFTNLWTLVKVITDDSHYVNLTFAAKYQPVPWLVDVVVSQAQRRGETTDRQLLLSWMLDDKLTSWFSSLKARYDSTAALYDIAEETDLPYVRRVLTMRLKNLVLDVLRKKVAL